MSRDGERIVTFEELPVKDVADEGKKYYELREELSNGSRWKSEVDSRKWQAVRRLDDRTIAYRAKLRAILEQEAIECRPQAQAGHVIVSAPKSLHTGIPFPPLLPILRN